MKRWLLSASVFAVLALSNSCSEIHSVLWDRLSVSGKGVILVKLKENGKDNYYLASGTNRVVPLRVVKETGRRFNSLDSLLDFTKVKPADVVLIEATSEYVREDDSRLEVVSALEKHRIWGREMGQD